MGEQRESSGLHGLKPGIVMVVIQFAYAGVNVLYKLATDDGMKINILIAYRFILASAFLLPLAFFVERYALLFLFIFPFFFFKTNSLLIKRFIW